MTHLPGTIDKGPGSLGLNGFEPTGMIVDERIIVDFFDPEFGFFEPGVGQQTGIQALNQTGEFVRQTLPVVEREPVSFVPESTIPSVPAFPTCPNVVRPPNIFDPGAIGMGIESTIEMLDSRSLHFIGIGLLIVFGILNLGR